MQSVQERWASGVVPVGPEAVPEVPQAPPRRHGADLKRSRAMAARLRLMIDGDPEPDPVAWRTMGMALWQGDPLADEVAAWMLAQGGARAWPLVEEALGLGPERAAQDARVPHCLAQLISRVHARPAWLDEARLRRGARVLQATGRLGTMVLRDAALMAGYQASAINQTLLRTGQLQRGAPQRIAETALWWLMCTDDGGLNPGAPGHVMTLKVRLMHALVRVRLQRAPDWDAAELGVPINQLDMQATYLAFSAVQLLGLRMTGDIFSRQDANAVMHLWRYVGWLMGVDECWLCDDEQTGRVLLYRNLLSQAPSDASSVALGRALMDEPLSRPYAWGARWRGRWDRACHLSLVRWFIGGQGMHNLGLPAAWPWYPLLLWGPRCLRSLSMRLLPFTRPWWRRWGRWQQQAFRRATAQALNEHGLTRPVP